MESNERLRDTRQIVGGNPYRVISSPFFPTKKLDGKVKFNLIIHSFFFLKSIKFDLIFKHRRNLAKEKCRPSFGSEVARHSAPHKVSHFSACRGARERDVADFASHGDDSRLNLETNLFNYKQCRVGLYVLS